MPIQNKLYQQNQTEEQRTENYRKHTDVSMQLVIDRIGLLHSDISELKGDVSGSLKDISTALTALVVLDQKQAHQNDNMQRIERELDRSKIATSELEDRIDTLEKEQPMTKQVVTWVMYFIGAVALAGFTFVGKATGFL